MIVVGLTAGIGAGASTVARLLKKNGFEIIEADAVARSVLKPNSLEWRKVVRIFGRQILDKNNGIDRERLGTIAFSSAGNLKRLNKIMLPSILKKIRSRLKGLEEQGKDIVILEAPLLIESGLMKDTDLLVVVTADTKTRIRRIVERDFFYPEEAVKRINAQLPLETKIEKADFVINNNGSLSETKKQVEKLSKKIKKMAGKK